MTLAFGYWLVFFEDFLTVRFVASPSFFVVNGSLGD
jgi:hypothetical protein